MVKFIHMISLLNDLLPLNDYQINCVLNKLKKFDFLNKKILILSSKSFYQNFKQVLKLDNEIDFDYQFSLSDYKLNINNYYFRIYHNSKDKQYYVTHNLQNGYTNIKPLTSQYIKALCNGKLIITFNRTIKDGSYFYNCTLKIEGNESETNKLQEFTRSVTSSPATFIGSKMEASNLFQDDINKGDFIISSYRISCNDNI